MVQLKSEKLNKERGGREFYSPGHDGFYVVELSLSSRTNVVSLGLLFFLVHFSPTCMPAATSQPPGLDLQRIHQHAPPPPFSLTNKAGSAIC